MHSSYEYQEELERFKTDINLTEVAATLGYTLDKRESSRNTAVMRHPNGDKICISKSAHDNHWIYWSARDDQDNGSIIDFIQHRKGGSLGDIRRTLRTWTGGNEPSNYVPDLKPATPDIQSVLAQYAKTQPTNHHPYLINHRGIPISTLEDPKFAGRIRIDQYGNAIFPHFNEEGIIGFEKKNQNYTRFSTNGCRGLWTSIPQVQDKQLIITESAIDALSFHTLYGDLQNRYISTGGQLGGRQLQLLVKAVHRLPADLTIAIAVDNDQAGDSYAKDLVMVFEHYQSQVTRLIPQFKDWNEDLKAFG